MTSSLAKTVTQNTTRWIKEFLLPNSLSQMSSKSPYSIHVETFSASSDEVKRRHDQNWLLDVDRDEHETDSSLAMGRTQVKQMFQHTPPRSLFIVFPSGLSTPASFEKYLKTFHKAVGVGNGPSPFFLQTHRYETVGYPYHPNNAHPVPPSPYPLLHVAPMVDIHGEGGAEYKYSMSPHLKDDAKAYGLIDELKGLRRSSDRSVKGSKRSRRDRRGRRDGL
jgi:hypothetical protein